MRQTSICSWKGFHLRTLGASTLHTAAWEGNVDIMQFLLESGQNPDAGDDNAITPMMVAILRLNVMTMRCIFVNGEAVRRNLVVDCRGEEDERRDKVIAVIKLLLRFGADIDARSQAGKTPLHYAVQEDCLLVTNLLLSHGSNIDVEDVDGVSQLALMLEQASMNVLQIFMNHHHLAATPQRRDFASALLLQAVNTQRDEVVRFIVENEYASIALTTTTGETLLHRAILKRNSAIMELLADLDSAGDNLTAATAKGDIPIHYAARYGSTRELEVLLQCLTNVFGELQDLSAENPINAVNQAGETALYIVGSTQLQRALERGIEAEANIDIRSVKVQFLLQQGARLFPPGVLVDELAPKDSISSKDISAVTLPVKVQLTLRHWLMEDGRCISEPEAEETAHQHPGDSTGTMNEALTELCMQWLAGVACAGSWTSFPSILICAGYAHEMVPLLVGLPLRRRSLPALLHQLEKFARRHPCHALILQLHDELLVAWRQISETRT
ncbi:hypothetical protein BBO99_00009733 [Phytophthora kernoviae]|uniref:Uncharacterized protein n=2 Tax=Phytophthora kernoviae TaxID=325452 RepID=A0A3R7J3F1_9STRA|nr:hypothetical protein G195_010275 [Phytophthora kernoviae 00238/432]KAG2509584.1 hypothetical protein JM16_008676 [Phytophthora kernoviae]KAG2510740.1 hypothetical protein JM18_008854 [Phytophthora kernoviae]RLN14315.1 hypothetical protein BBI17_009041 [Phytophthora kernoviae]RLN72652.1 hypothetical protein BBO99_00009733 [Phytophthora kernoviae]